MKQLSLIIIIISFSVISHANEKFEFNFSINQQTETDTLRNPDNFYYLSDLPIKQVGELILNDSIYPSDNFVTFALLDTISRCKENDLEFFLKVSEKIINDADGALAETVGSYTRKFIEKRPTEFINHIDKLSEEQIRKWADFTFYDMYFAYSEDELKTNCKKLVDSLKKISTTKSVAYFEKELNTRIKNGI
ncbi:hypothetical protein [Prolixibacter sp. NT017]|uniref:hypothetical protein n=1 Tax=Prolixibacter sp. NT017 TaxID=2652390 RepID=UPI001277976E|nr:hypothetical protein [Prolixibacter sp. NT017]GET24787.1 hypothetical protein NT017_11160 [Prolixibacter sp. NT017]